VHAPLGISTAAISDAFFNLAKLRFEDQIELFLCYFRWFTFGKISDYRE
jgi:hypothetical protein